MVYEKKDGKESAGQSQKTNFTSNKRMSKADSKKSSKCASCSKFAQLIPGKDTGSLECQTCNNVFHGACQIPPVNTSVVIKGGHDS